MKKRQQEYESRKREEERRQLEENRYNGKSITEIANEIRALSTNEFRERYNAFNEINPHRRFVEVLLMGAFDKPDARKKYEDILINRIADKMGLPRLELLTSASVSQATSPFVLFNLKTQQMEQPSSAANVQQENGVTQLSRNFEK